MSQINSIGRRKTSTARAYLQKGKGTITVNNKTLEDYFPMQSSRNMILLPLQVTEFEGQYDIKLTIRGGGTTGQAEAAQLGIARAIDIIDPEKHSVLKEHGLLTRDDRMVERKKYGQPKARKQFQFSKR